MIFGGMVDSFKPSTSKDDTVKLAGENSLLFLYVGIGAFIASVLSFGLFMMTGE